MLRGVRKFLFLFLASGLLFISNSFSQMPGWQTVEDRDGNVYFLDRNGKIWTSGKPEFYYKPVSMSGLDYYVNHGIELIRRHYHFEGLTILKSILALPVNNQKVYRAQVKSSQVINTLIKREGERFTRLNARASLLLIKLENKTILIDDRMQFRVEIPHHITILRRNMRERLEYLYQGVLIGLTVNERMKANKKEGERFDALMVIDAERYRSRIRSVRQLEKNWENNLGGFGFKRELRDSYEHGRIYTFEGTPSSPFSGFDGFFVKGRYGYFVRIISSTKLVEKYREELHSLMKGFRI
jgi:hypothetical protein